MVYTGYLGGAGNVVDAFANCDAEMSLIFATTVTVIFMALLYLPRKVISFHNFMQSLAEGAKLMMPAILILTFAWTLKGMGDNLGIAEFVRSVVGTSMTASAVIPAVMFGIALFLGFSTGTSSLPAPPKYPVYTMPKTADTINTATGSTRSITFPFGLIFLSSCIDANSSPPEVNKSPSAA